MDVIGVVWEIFLMVYVLGGIMGEGGNMDFWSVKLLDMWDILGWNLDVLRY